MRVYLSGGRGKNTPEFLIASRRPHVMLTFLEVKHLRHSAGGAWDRLRHHVFRKIGKDRSKCLAKRVGKYRPPPKKTVKPTKKKGMVY